MIMDVESQSLLDQECPICYDAITKRDILEPCGHQIHASCFLMSKSELCPICRQVVEIPLSDEIEYHIPPVQPYITFGTIIVVVSYLFLFMMYNHLHPIH
jgi:hypothetical protein